MTKEKTISNKGITLNWLFGFLPLPYFAVSISIFLSITPSMLTEIPVRKTGVINSSDGTN